MFCSKTDMQRVEKAQYKVMEIHDTEAATRGVLYKKARNFIKKDTLAQVFCCEFCEMVKNTFSYRTLPGDSSNDKILLVVHGN